MAERWYLSKSLATIAVPWSVVTFYDFLRSLKAGEHSIVSFLSRVIIENVSVGLI